MRETVYVNGNWLDEQHATVSVFDHGLLYGDGVYEGIRIYNGIMFKFDEHFIRLIRSARGIGLTVPATECELREIIEDGARRSGLKNAYVRIVLTRGVGPIGPDPEPCSQPNLIIILKDVPPLHGNGDPIIRTAISTIRRVAVDSSTAEIKSLNYLPSVLAKAEVARLGVDEAILLDSQGFISEAPVSNIFIRDGGRILTPSVANGILPGITRRFVIEILQSNGWEVTVGNVTPTQLLNADEAFLTGTHSEIVAIGWHNGQLLGNGHPGVTFKEIRAAFNECTSQ